MLFKRGAVFLRRPRQFRPQAQQRGTEEVYRREPNRLYHLQDTPHGAEHRRPRKAQRGHRWHRAKHQRHPRPDTTLHLHHRLGTPHRHEGANAHRRAEQKGG